MRSYVWRGLYPCVDAWGHPLEPNTTAVYSVFVSGTVGCMWSSRTCERPTVLSYT